MLASALMASAVSTGAAETEVKKIRAHQSAERTRIVLDLSAEPQYKAFLIPSPDRLVVDIKNVVFPPERKLPSLARPPYPIREVRVGRSDRTEMRLVFDLSQAVELKQFTLPATSSAGRKYASRLVLDLSNPGKAEWDKAKQTQPVKESGTRPAVLKVTQLRDLIVVVDAGHGGRDPGALGHGVIEKDVVLNIAKAVQQRLSAEKGIKSILTRKRDKYVTHKKRTQIAVDAKADMFVSIHADAFTNNQARGASVYAVSYDGINNQANLWYDNRDNRSDTVGGHVLRETEPVLARTLMDLKMDGSLRNSVEAGYLVLDFLNTVTELHKTRVEQASFIVLKSPTFPSILVETGFISHPGDAKKLANRAHQQKLAEAISYGILKFLEREPPDDSFLAHHPKNGHIDYVIRSGDTLSEIAFKYRVSTEKLRVINGLASSVIHVGQVIRIPTR